MISRGVEISIAGGVEEMNGERQIKEATPNALRVQKFRDKQAAMNISPAVPALAPLVITAMPDQQQPISLHEEIHLDLKRWLRCRMFTAKACRRQLTAFGLAKAIAAYWKESIDEDNIANWSVNNVDSEVQRTIGSRTARRWLHKLGFNYKEYRKGVYNDRHQREDVKAYRDHIFLPRISAYPDEFLLRDENLQEIPKPLHLSSIIQPLILVTQYEYTFNSNNRRHYIWVHPEHQPLHKKGHGQGLYESDFLTPLGRL
ncbi:hypothetical protein B9Z19DRAFT_1127013 [Tuber borchii]|uniref:Winged helix-turn helix domain-containing protein n=1 Tax=Tuber borchii TaxID=42251 RepID=A0A2T6ZS34_TUBBO|nr:hypothetical protein B9Z19DRAFT_1127013 [Tuber borchii]